jgi:hypothetical protein
MIFAILLKGYYVIDNHGQKTRTDKAPKPHVPLVDLGCA